MTVAAAFVAGLLVARVLWFVCRPVFDAELLLRTNVRGVAVPVGVGILVPLAALGVEAGRAVARVAVGSDAGTTGAITVTLLAALGFGLLGLVDDLLGDAVARGFRGHVGAIRHGRWTTGSLKLVGGGLVALLAVAPAAQRSPVRLVVGAALVALAANLANLLDRAPGRTGKVALLLFVVLAVAARADATLTTVAVVAGAGLALLLDDLHERLMLGDAGANVLGGVLGLGVVLVAPLAVQAGVAAVLAVLNGLSEVVSFSRVIAAVAPLRAADAWGRHRR